MSSASGEVKGEVINEFSKIDVLLEGSDDEKQTAKKLLEEMYKTVSHISAILRYFQGDLKFSENSIL